MNVCKRIIALFSAFVIAVSCFIVPASADVGDAIRYQLGTWDDFLDACASTWRFTGFWDSLMESHVGEKAQAYNDYVSSLPATTINNDGSFILYPSSSTTYTYYHSSTSYQNPTSGLSSETPPDVSGNFLPGHISTFVLPCSCSVLLGSSCSVFTNKGSYDCKSSITSSSGSSCSSGSAGSTLTLSLFPDLYSSVSGYSYPYIYVRFTQPYLICTPLNTGLPNYNSSDRVGSGISAAIGSDNVATVDADGTATLTGNGSGNVAGAGLAAGALGWVDATGELHLFDGSSLFGEGSSALSLNNTGGGSAANPATGDTYNVSDWSYDYDQRKYTYNIDNSSTTGDIYDLKGDVVYGDKNATVTITNNNGDTTTYTYNYYITNNYGDDSGGGGGGSGNDPSGDSSGGSLPPSVVEGTTSGMQTLFDTFADLITGLQEFYNGYTSFLAALFPMIPTEIYTVVTVGIVLCVIAAVIKKFL